MNWKVFGWVSVGEVAIMLLLQQILASGFSNNLAFEAFHIPLVLLSLPMRLYFFYIRQGAASLPAVILWLVLSGVVWGFIVERVVSAVRRRRPTSRPP